VLGANVDPAAATSPAPELAGGIWPLRAVLDGSPDAERQLEPESMQGHAPVFTLGTPFGRLGRNSRGSVCQDDRGLNLVAILSPWSGTTSGSKFTLCCQRRGIECGGMVARTRRVVFLGGAVHKVGHRAENVLFLFKGTDLRLMKYIKRGHDSHGLPAAIASGPGSR
jgi:hypothetical protein